MSEAGDKLKLVREEILEVFKRHDVGGHCVIHTPGHAEVFSHLTPSYSCMQVTDVPGGAIARFRSILGEVGGDKELQKFQQEATANMMVLFAEIMGRAALSFISGSRDIDQATGATHDPSTYVPYPPKGH